MANLRSRGKAPGLIVAEEKCPIFEYRAAGAHALPVVLESRFPRKGITVSIRRVIQIPGVGIVTVALVKPIPVSVQSVRPTLAHQGNVSSGGPAKVCG